MSLGLASRSDHRIVDLIMVLFSTVLFFLSHPNFLFIDGLGFLSFFSLVPFFYIISRNTQKFVFLFAFVFAFFFYISYGFWLYNYGLTFLLCISIYYGLFYGFVMLLSKIVCNRICVHKYFSYFVFALFFCVLEYVKVQGPLGFSYGVSGYTLWKMPFMLKLSSLGGVWIPSFFCVFSSAIICSLVDLLKQKNFKKIICIVFVYFFSFSLCFFFSDLVCKNKKNEETYVRSVAAIQNNADSTKYDGEVYKKDIANLLDETKKVLDIEACDFIVFPETAVVPPILYNYERKTNLSRYNAIQKLLSFVNKTDSCFVIGNQHRIEKDEILDYNSVLIFDRKLDNVLPPNPLVYNKVHLVPFSETLPFDSVLHSLYDFFINDRSFVWTKGDSRCVFNVRGIPFATPICFEDTFGSDCRKFVKNGARCFFNLSNDSWAKSKVCQRQHLAMSVFRCAENSVPMVRSTASGSTCIIDRYGKVVASCEDFTQDFVFSFIEIPIFSVLTPYTFIGDWFAFLELFLAIFLLFVAFVRKIMKVKI